ncbi:serine hydrolase [Pedobacter antarcticus]|uniref:serine hydrolase domain-containing protein n=1 Tax=Pedobacter antarcticus TaxID=34086 RepID=UPI002931B20F|nr:serine hydrolase [Pedobacter antarcticus]
MKPLKKSRRLSSLVLSLICFTIFSSLTAFITVKKRPTNIYSCEYCENKEAKNLNDSLDVLLNQVKQSFGKDALNLTIGVVKDGHVFLKKNYGYSNPERKTAFSDHSQIYLASTSKSLTGTLAAVLDHKGIIKLDRTLADYLPELNFDDKNIHPNQITIASLITHTHGIKNNDAVVWTAFIGHKGNEQLIEVLKKYSTALPDTNFYYSNLGSVIYALIVERQTGKPWQQVMANEVFKPLGMQSTTAYVSKVNRHYISYVIDGSEGKQTSIFDKADNSMSAAGGHLSTVDDLLKYLQFFLSDGDSAPGLLNKSEIIFACSPIVAQSSRYQSYERYGYGLGWEQSIFNGEKLVSRLGGYSGISSHLSFIKNRNIGIVVLSNKKGMEALSHLVANYVYNSILNKENKDSVLKANLASLKRNFDADVEETKEVDAAKRVKIPMNEKYAGIYQGGEKSGYMEINKKGKVSWGNLKGQLYMISDSTGLINFRTMLRSFSVKKEDGEVAGVYSNERYFRR